MLGWHSRPTLLGVTDSADAGVASLSAPAGIVAGMMTDWNGPEYGGGVMTCGDRISPGVWCRERTQIQNDFDCQYVN